MSESVLILGESGHGKSHSIQFLNPEETYIIGVLNKSLPFRGWKNKYKKGNNGEGNYYVTDSPAKIVFILDGISKSRNDIKNIIIDDFQFTMSNEFMRGTQESKSRDAVFKKFNDIGFGSFLIANKINQLRDDIKVFVLTHSHRDQNGFSKIKTVGTLTDEKVTLEGHFTIVLHAIIRPELPVDKGRYSFITNATANELAKSPFGMFDELNIQNDLQFISDTMDEYNGMEEQDAPIKNQPQEVVGA